jgi:myo-inositol-1(or 4)-monophosphatase
MHACVALCIVDLHADLPFCPHPDCIYPLPRIPHQSTHPPDPAGMSDAFWEFRLKPWDMAAGVLIAEEAGGTVTTMDGRAFSGEYAGGGHALVCVVGKAGRRAHPPPPSSTCAAQGHDSLRGSLHAFAVFDRSVVVSNSYLHEQLLAVMEPAASKLVADGIDLSQWFVPSGYKVHTGAQLE